MRLPIAAGIVLFRSDPTLVLPLVATIDRAVSATFVFVNGGVGDSLLDHLLMRGVVVLRSDRNIGIAEALNRLAVAAEDAGYGHILFLDQDSSPPEDMAQMLFNTMVLLEQSGAMPAVVGPRIVTPSNEGNEFKAPRYFAMKRPKIADASPVVYVITSGSLISLAAFRCAGPFRADFFIDAVDTEWCFRVWAKDGSCWVHDHAHMTHRIGAGVVRNLGTAIPKQAPFRLYAYVRNQMNCVTLPHIPLLWKLRFSAHVCRVILVSWIDARFAHGVLVALVKAACRGLCGKLGPPPGVPLTDQQGGVDATTLVGDRHDRL